MCLTKQVFEKGLVLFQDAVECGPVGPPIRKRVFPHPASTGKLVEVLTRVSGAVHRFHYLTRHRDTCFREAKAMPTDCREQLDWWH